MAAPPSSLPACSDPLLEETEDTEDHEEDYYSADQPKEAPPSAYTVGSIDGIRSAGSSSSSGSASRAQDRRSCDLTGSNCASARSSRITININISSGSGSAGGAGGARSDFSSAEEAPGTETEIEIETETETATTTRRSRTTTSTTAATSTIAAMATATAAAAALPSPQGTSRRSRRGSGRTRGHHRRPRQDEPRSHHRHHRHAQSRDYPRLIRPASTSSAAAAFPAMGGALSMLEACFGPSFGGEPIPLSITSRHSTRNLDTNSCARVQRLLPQLHRTLLAAAFFACSAIVAAIALALRVGMALIASRDDQNCQGPMREWLRSYLLMWLIAPTLLPLAVLVRRASPSASRMALHILWPSSVVSLLGWSAGGAAYLRPPSKCSPLHGLAAEALSLQLLHIMLLTIAVMYIAAAQPLVRKVNDTLARSELVAQAAALSVEIPREDLPSSQECVICLGCVEDEEQEAGARDMNPDDLDLEAAVCQHLEDTDRPSADGQIQPPETRPRWRQVQCGHRFHEDCLFEWLRKARVPSARRCPVCRHSLRRQACRRHSRG